MKALVADDDTVILKLLVRVLELLGHEAVAFEDPLQAWEALQQGCYPLVVLDWIMPGISGLELCRKLRALPHGQRSIVVIVTGRDTPEDLAAVLDAGADDYLTKPLNLEQLRIRMAIAARNAAMLTERYRFEQQLVEVSSAEQNRIGQDLHDGIGQMLTGVSYLGKALENQLVAKGSPLAAQAAKINELVSDASKRMHQLASGLMFVELTAEGLCDALAELVEHVQSLYPMTCEYQFDKSACAGNDRVASEFYRIAYEAVHNAIKHSGSDRLTISLTRDRRYVHLAVTDYGRGLPANAEAGSGLGLRSMRYRARLIGASLSVLPGEHGGTVVRCALGPGDEGLA